MGAIRAAIGVVLFLTCWALPAIGQDVTLTSRDGSVEIVGTLLGYDGEFYRIDSIYGVLTVDGSGVLCAGPGCPDLESYVAEIVATGAPPLANVLLPALLQAFAIQHDYTLGKSQTSDGQIVFQLADVSSGRIAARFRVQATGSDEAFADLLAEESDIAMSLREVSEDEVIRGDEAGLGTFSSPGQNRVIALDALVPVVSPRNPVQEITLDDLVGIYSGKIANWQQLGGIDAPIIRHFRDTKSAVAQVFRKRIMEPSGFAMVASIQRHNSNQDLIAAVSADPFAIGVSTQATPGNTRPLGLTGGCGFRAEATPEALKSDDYPMTAPLFFYLAARRLPAVGREFLRFSQSSAAQIAILRAGFVDQGMSRIPISRQGDRLVNAIQAAGEEISLGDLQRMVQELDGSRRLSVTFRFDGGSSRLTAQSRSNVALLARALETGTLGTRELTFVGFSDGEGSAEVNQRLSRQRAKSVRDAVVAEAPTADLSRINLAIKGFGEALPMACDDTEWGRQINRRVEIWVR